MPTFSSLEEDGDFSDFLKPTNALIHLPDTPMVILTSGQLTKILKKKNALTS